MKTIIIYNSETGFTAQYAQWIAEALQCEKVELKKAKLNTLADYDTIIYGGWLMAGNVTGYNKIKALNLKNLLVFATGMAPFVEEMVDKVAEQNGIDRKCFFYYQGGYRPEKLGFMKRSMINMMKKSIEKKQDKSEEDIAMLKLLEGGDYSDKEAIKELVAYVQSLK